MHVTDTLMKDLIKDDPVFRAHLLNNMGGERSPFLLIDIGDRYRAIVAGDTVKDIARFKDPASIERINAVAKGLAMQTKSIPTHLKADGGIPTKDDLVSVLRQQQMKGAVGRDYNFTFKDPKSYESLYYSAIQAKSTHEGTPKTIEQLKATYAAHEHANNLKSATAKMLANSAKMAGKNKKESSSGDVLESASTLTGIGIVTLAALSHHLSSADADLGGVTIAAVTGGLALASTQLAKDTAKHAHTFLMKNSPWYRTQTDSYVNNKMNKIIESGNIRSVSHLDSEQMRDLVNLYHKAHPDANIKSAGHHIENLIDDYKTAKDIELDTKAKQEQAMADFAIKGR